MEDKENYFLIKSYNGMKYVANKGKKDDIVLFASYALNRDFKRTGRGAPLTCYICKVEEILKNER